MALLLFDSCARLSRPVPVSRQVRPARARCMLACGAPVTLLPPISRVRPGLTRHDDAGAVRRLRRGVRGVCGVAISGRRRRSSICGTTPRRLSPDHRTSHAIRLWRAMCDVRGWSADDTPAGGSGHGPGSLPWWIKDRTGCVRPSLGRGLEWQGGSSTTRAHIWEWLITGSMPWHGSNWAPISVRYRWCSRR